jgi:hypothetical protein
LHAAGALAQAVGRAVGYDKTALMFIERDTATLAVVETADGSVVKVLRQSLDGADATAVVADMVASLEAQGPVAQGMFVVGSGVDVAAVNAHLQDIVSVPVIAPEEPQLALARGAALASANAPRYDTSTIGLAYSQDPDETMAYPTALAGDATTFLGLHDDASPATADVASDLDGTSERSKPFLLVGSSLTAIFVAGMMALAIAMATSVQPTVDQGSGQMPVRPGAAAPPPALQQVPTTVPAPAQAAPPSAATATARLKVPPAPPPPVFVRNEAPAPAALPPPPAAPPGIPPPFIPWLPPIPQPPPYYNPQWYPGPIGPWGHGGPRHGHGGD